jgi:hypothetical protein
VRHEFARSGFKTFNQVQDQGGMKDLNGEIFLNFKNCIRGFNADIGPWGRF